MVYIKEVRIVAISNDKIPVGYPLSLAFYVLLSEVLQYDVCVEYVLAVNDTSNIIRRGVKYVRESFIGGFDDIRFSQPGVYKIFVGARLC